MRSDSARLLQRRAERVDELVGQLADEADGVGQQVRAIVEPREARGRIERVEQPVADADVVLAREGVQQRGLACVRVAGERDLGHAGPLALGAHRRARALHLGELAAQRRDAVAGEAAVRLDLGLTGSTGERPAPGRAQALEVGPQPPHAGHVVLELRELDLQLAVGGVRVVGEDPEDHGGAVDDGELELLLQVALLARGELVVGGDHVGVGRLGRRLHLGDLAGAQIGVRVRLVAVLDRLAHDRDSGGAKQLVELGQVVAGLQCADGERALLRPAFGLGRAVAGRRGAAVAISLHAPPILVGGVTRQAGLRWRSGPRPPGPGSRTRRPRPARSRRASCRP